MKNLPSYKVLLIDYQDTPTFVVPRYYWEKIGNRFANQTTERKGTYSCTSGVQNNVVLLTDNSKLLYDT